MALRSLKMAKVDLILLPNKATKNDEKKYSLMP